MSTLLPDIAITQSPLRKMFRPYRILIMKKLEQANDGISFQDLKERLNLTDGNLASHLKSLEDEGYIKFIKITEGHRTKTIYQLTTDGREILRMFTQQLIYILSGETK